jgi:hypothetical protein
MAETTRSDPPRLADALTAQPEGPSGEQPEYDTWLTHAHAPGDPPPPQLSHAEVGTD